MAQPSVQEWLDTFHAQETKVWVEDPGKIFVNIVMSILCSKPGKLTIPCFIFKL